MKAVMIVLNLLIATLWSEISSNYKGYKQVSILLNP